MRKNAALEPTGITDDITSAPIYVSTTCRIMFRAKNPTWKKVPNKQLNAVIAKQFAAATHDKFFKPKKAAPNLIGETRKIGSVKFIALNFKNQIWVIAVSKTSSPVINQPAPVRLPAKPSPAPVDLPDMPEKKAARDDWLRSHRGFLENHYFDIFQGMYALDHNSFEAMKSRARDSGDAVAYLKSLHKSGKDGVDHWMAENLHQISEREMQTEPTGRSGMLAPPEAESL